MRSTICADTRPRIAFSERALRQANPPADCEAPLRTPSRAQARATPMRHPHLPRSTPWLPKLRVRSNHGSPLQPTATTASFPRNRDIMAYFGEKRKGVRKTNSQNGACPRRSPLTADRHDGILSEERGHYGIFRRKTQGGERNKQPKRGLSPKIPEDQEDQDGACPRRISGETTAPSPRGTGALCAWGAKPARAR